MINNKKGLGRGLDALFGVYKDDSYDNITIKTDTIFLIYFFIKTSP